MQAKREQSCKKLREKTEKEKKNHWGDESGTKPTAQTSAQTIQYSPT